MLLFLGAALGLRIATFGNPNLDADDQFYALVGQRMHDGLLPYVDMWDRKPLGLFVIYYLIAGVSRAVVAYQIAAWLFAAATAWVVYGITREIIGGVTSRRGAIFAGLAYSLELGPFDGEGGQAPVFYNLFIALAALLVLRARHDLARGAVPRGVWGAMALAGLAISVKETAMFEAGFLGLWVLWHLYRGGMRAGALAAHAVGFALIGMLPFALTALPYLITHHWHEYWQAVVVSNLTKKIRTDTLPVLGSTAARMVPLFPLALLGLVMRWRKNEGAWVRVFLLYWLLAASIGFVSVPIFSPHYALPLLVPLCLITGPVFAQANGGILAFAATICATLLWYNPADRAWNLHAIASTEALAEAVKQHDHGRGMLLYHGPTYLYALTGSSFFSPLVFPNHLFDAAERNVSHIDTDTEIDRILARKPGVVVMLPERYICCRFMTENLYAWKRVQDYVHSDCRRVALVRSNEHQTITPIAVYGDCGLASPLHPVPKARATP